MYLGTVIYSRTNQQLCQYYISVGKMLPSKSSKREKKKIPPKSERDDLFQMTERILISWREGGSEGGGEEKKDENILFRLSMFLGEKHNC